MMPMRVKRSWTGALLTMLAAGYAAGPGYAQPWDVLEDSLSGSVCGLVNAANAELVILADTGELVDVSGRDAVLLGTFVDLDLTVFVDGFEAGFIDFFEDGDGFATLWWVFDASEEVVELDANFDPFPSGFFPEDFVDVPCDACEFWDDPLDCDEDFDGVPDPFDLCPGTPLDEPVDDDGCSCFDFDSDADGVVDCFDLCPRTPLNLAVDVDGCPISVVRPGLGGGRLIAIGCGGLGAPGLALTFAGLAGLNLRRRRAVEA